MPGQSLVSIDALLASASDYGTWSPLWFDRMSNAATAAVAASGGCSCARFPNPLTVPTPTAPLTGVVFPTCRGVISSGLAGVVIGLEFKLGHFVIGTGFTQDSTMPSRWIKGQTVQWAGSLLFAVIDAAITGTPTITATYTNQDGTASQVTSNIVLPVTTALNSAFLISSFLASGDTGMRAVTNMTNAGATVGTISIRALMPIGVGLVPTATLPAGNIDPLSISMVPWIAQGGDIIAAYQFGSATQNDLMAHLVGVGDI